MDSSKLALFKSEEEVISYAKVNGRDEGGVASLVSEWKILQKKPKKMSKSSKNFKVITQSETKK